ncbi:hypothetical protein AKJ09_00776 [Labilithrix luteola]|uniref:Uncharacterized protein n=1 Tax=Labilithrix luteola TaxID=1391654 RepID=A0A0K1PKR6_9BACT|nr:hypothetical protein AKJ09_00776 [Labilithrix luteola]
MRAQPWRCRTRVGEEADNESSFDADHTSMMQRNSLDADPRLGAVMS